MSADAEGPRFNFLRAAHDQMRILLCKTWDQPPQTQSLSTNLRQLLKKLTSEILTTVKYSMEFAKSLSNFKFVSSKIGTHACAMVWLLHLSLIHQSRHDSSPSSALLFSGAVLVSNLTPFCGLPRGGGGGGTSGTQCCCTFSS